jgi:site-specific recombinase XerD
VRSTKSVQKVVDDYVRSMRRRGLAHTTIDGRHRDLWAWLDHVEGDWADATRADVEEWISSRPLAVGARYGAIARLHAFYVWACRVELTDRDPTALVERPRLPRRLPRPARVDDVALLLERADAEMRAMVCLMVDAGLRCCEVAGLDWRDVDVAERVLYVRGKGSHDRVVGIPRRLLYALEELGPAVGPVIRPQRGDRVRLSPWSVSQRVNRHARIHGTNLTAHQLRHLYATRLYRALDGRIGPLQQALGHASWATTQIYALVDPATALEAARALDALEGDELVDDGQLTLF